MRKIFFLWLAWGLLGFYFHEAWRDEAQAWLVAKSAMSVKDLFFLSSLEATPPVYYVLLWPWAKLRPGGFLWLQWVVSFAGTAGAVWLILKSKIFNSPLVRILLSFSFLFAFEFSGISRLYGWGFFFLLGGLYFEQNRRPLAGAVAFSLASLTQGPFGLAVCGFYAYKFFEQPGKFFKVRWGALIILTLSLVLFVWQQNLASELREWSGELAFPKRLSLLGGTLASPFVHIPENLGYLGFLVSALALWVLPAKTRLPFLIVLAGHAFVFAFVYGHFAGAAKPRHGSALFLIFLYFFQQTPWAESLASVFDWKSLAAHFKAHFILKNKRVLVSELFVFLLLFVSTLSGVYFKVLDIVLPFSDSKDASLAIQKNSASPVLFAWDEQDTYAVQAYLNLPVLVGSNFSVVTTPQYTKARNILRRNDFANGPQWQSLRLRCPQNRDCFVVLRARWGEAPGNFEKIFKARRTISDESLNVFKFANGR